MQRVTDSVSDMGHSSKFGTNILNREMGNNNLDQKVLFGMNQIYIHY